MQFNKWILKKRLIQDKFQDFHRSLPKIRHAIGNSLRFTSESADLHCKLEKNDHSSVRVKFVWRHLCWSLFSPKLIFRYLNYSQPIMLIPNNIVQWGSENWTFQITFVSCLYSNNLNPGHSITEQVWTPSVCILLIVCFLS